MNLTHEDQSCISGFVLHYNHSRIVNLLFGTNANKYKYIYIYIDPKYTFVPMSLMEFSTLTKLFHSYLVPWLVVLSIATTSLNPAMASKHCHFPAIFNFGASHADTGGLAASFPFAAPKPPSGDTFFHRPAGRFCDGRLIIDFIGNVHYFLFHRVYVSNAAYFEVLHTARGIIVVCSVNVLV